jgi:hypothetical protein
VILRPVSEQTGGLNDALATTSRARRTKSVLNRAENRTVELKKCPSNRDGHQELEPGIAGLGGPFCHQADSACSLKPTGTDGRCGTERGLDLDPRPGFLGWKRKGEDATSVSEASFPGALTAHRSLVTRGTGSSSSSV